MKTRGPRALWILLGFSTGPMLAHGQADWLNVLKKTQERIPRCSAEWTVERILPANPALAAAMAETIDKEIRGATDPMDKAALEKKKLAISGPVAAGQKIQMRIKVDFFGLRRYYIAQTFIYPEGNVDYEYFANGDGMVQAVNRRGRSVRLLKEDGRILDELARGLPELILGKNLVRFNALNLVKDDPGEFLFEGSLGDAQLIEIGVEKATFQLRRLQVGSGRDAARGHLNNPVLDVEARRIRNSGSYPVPEEVVYRQFQGQNQLQMQETWNLVSWTDRTDSSQMHGTKYELEPRQVVTDERATPHRTYPSDEVLK